MKPWSNLIFFDLGAFDEPEVIHVDGEVDPVRDLDTISEELRLKDEDTLLKNLDKVEKLVIRGTDKKMKPEHVSRTLQILANEIVTWSQQSDLWHWNSQALHLWQSKHDSLRLISRSLLKLF